MAFITLDSVCVDFPIYNISARSLKKKFLRMSTGGVLSRDERECVVVKALDNLSFHLQDGDRVGIVGHNGAGKSTLLRVLASIYEPTAGHIIHEGKISPLLDTMLGINMESTGYENILLRGLLLGIPRKEMIKKIDDIVQFTELGDYLNVPIRTYSSGMLMRLAFSVATCIQPEILLMDEVIGVSDENFLERARNRLNQLIAKANIVVLASHSKEIIKNLCNKAILMNAGKLELFDTVDKVLERLPSVVKA
ncbi:MAG: ABC transporter ATP-binding protein [Gammaproteobacteria bacterium]|nr:ABC transporter ATP-binding protein [Gammaproteobacteria bacterium]